MLALTLNLLKSNFVIKIKNTFSLKNLNENIYK